MQVIVKCVFANNPLKNLRQSEAILNLKKYADVSLKHIMSLQNQPVAPAMLGI